MSERLILYAEDEPNDVFLMKRAFREASISNLRIVADGKEVVDYLSGHTPYEGRVAYPLPVTVLLDINLPRLSGLEALAWIRQQSIFSELPVVMLTSSVQEKDLSRAYATGATAFLVKSASAAALVEVAKALRRILISDTVSEGD